MADEGRMGDLADQSSYDPFAAETFLHPDLADFTRYAAQDTVNRPTDLSPTVYQTPYGGITQNDMSKGMDAGLSFSGGGLATKPIRAYHSSPHDFDRFDLSKIGTGEGAQVYGHGLYFAENPAVSGQGGQYWQQFLGKFGGTPEGDAARELMKAKFDRAKASDYLGRDLRSMEELGLGKDFPDYAQKQQAIEMLKSGQPVGPRTYEVNINADPAHFLDWDKTIPADHPVRQVKRGLNTNSICPACHDWSKPRQ